jgi:GNAT superfamily N-acetyltransferase
LNDPTLQGAGPVIEVGRPAPSELPAVNAVVEAAVMGWALPERVKRLALPAYRYDGSDLEHLDFVIARSAADGQVLGVAAWERADPAACPEGRDGALLHGLYVAPGAQHGGIGSALVGVVLAAAAAAGREGVLVRAQRDAEAFFQRQGFRHLPAVDSERDYAGRFWKAVRT